jgi:rhodanese-related sulfurtransferase
MKKLTLIILVTFSLCTLLYGIPFSEAADINRMTKEELKPMLGSPDLMVIDVRKASDWDSSELKIKDAVREDPEQVETWMGKYPKERALVFYCA